MKKINECLNSELEKEILSKLNELVKDSGQRLTESDLEHLSHRMPNLLNNKFGHLGLNYVFSSWEMGIYGSYSTSTKITVTNLISWVFTSLKKDQETRQTTPENTTKFIEWNERFNSTISEVLSYLRISCKLFPQDIDPEHDPLFTKSVSPVLRKIEKDYLNAKKSRNMYSFKKEILTKYKPCEYDNFNNLGLR